jgi:hypothetical protein
MKKAVFCIVNSEEQATHILARLRAARFCQNSISLLGSDKTCAYDAANGLAQFIATGPIVAALFSQAPAGGPVAGISGALIGMGLTDFEARRYDSKVRGGKVLISVHSESANLIDRATEIFNSSGAQGIATTGDTVVQETR